MASDTRRISVGFKGGQVLALRVVDEELDAVHEALAGGGWRQIESEDGPVRVNLDHVVYVSADSDEPHVGFG
jgi:hypothetical protein